MHHQNLADPTSTETTDIDYSYLTDLVGHLAGLIHLQATQWCSELLQPLGLTPKQFVALEFISNNPEISQKDIAHHIGTTPSVMVGILDDLARSKLIQRVRSETDRRVQFVQVTDRARDILDEIRQKAFEVEARIDADSGLTADERAQLLKLLRKAAKRP